MTSSANDADDKDDNATITLRIRQRDETSFDMEVDVLKTTVGGLKRQLNDSAYVRLIAAGRLLEPETATLAELKLRDMDVIHAVITDHPQNHGQRHSKPSDCSDSEDSGLDDDEMDGVYYEDDQENDIEAARTTTMTMRSRTGTTTRFPLGFDRLRTTANLRTAEIIILRSYFNDRIDAWLLANESVRERIQSIEPNDALRRRRLQEDAWMAVQSDTSEFAMNVSHAVTTRGQDRFSSTRRQLFRTRQSSPFDFVLGLNLGYFIGYYMLAFVWVPSIPQRQKAGIVTGYCLRLINGVSHPNTAEENGIEYADDVVYGD